MATSETPRVAGREAQLRALDVSAEAFEGLVIIETSRTFLSLTPAEARRFHQFFTHAYRQALAGEQQKAGNGGGAR